MQISKFQVPIEEKECSKDQREQTELKASFQLLTIDKDAVKNTKNVQLKQRN